MGWHAYVQAFLAGAFLTNGVPHFVAGLMGMPFQSPFAKPPGIGESSPLSNALWGFGNLVVGAMLLHAAAPGTTPVWAVFCAGCLLMSLQLSTHFGKVRAPGYVHKAK